MKFDHDVNDNYIMVMCYKAIVLVINGVSKSPKSVKTEVIEINVYNLFLVIFMLGCAANIYSGF